MLRVDLLGSVRACHGDQVIDLGSARNRSVFAVLALRANQVVSRAELIAGVWGDDPPASVEGRLYTCVSDLRRALEPERTRWSGSEVLASAPGGYQLRLDPAGIDVTRFEQLRETASDTDWADAHRLLCTALELWRGEALADADGPFAARHRARLAELRLATVERRAEAALALGRHAEVVTELSALVRDCPARETLRGLLMTALHRCGRSGEALDIYRQAEQALCDELGIEPGPAMRQLRDRIERETQPNEVLRWAALLGDDFNLGELAAVLGRQPSDLVTAVEDAVAAGVLTAQEDHFAFRHASVRDELYDGMPRAVRVELHRQAAWALNAAGTDPERVARQLLAGEAEVDGWLVDWLLAHSNALARQAPELAAELLERAVRSTLVRDNAREELTVRLARLRFRLGERPEADARAVLAMTADGYRAAEMRLLLAHLRYSREGPP